MQGFNRPGPAPRDVIEEVGSGPNYSRQVAAPTPANVVMAGGRSVVANPRVVGWDQEGDPIMKQPKAAFTNKDLQFPFPNRTNPGMAFIAASTEAPTTGIPGIDEVSVPVLTQLTGMHIPGIGQAVTTAGPYIAGLGRQAAGDIVDTARFAGSGLTYVAENLRPILAQGRADIGKGIRDLRQGYEDIGILGNQIGAAHNKYLVQPTQRLAGRLGLSLPTSAFQQSAPLETGKESILFDHPDVAQSGTGSDEVQNNRNYIAQGNVDLEGKPITVGEFDSAYPAEMYTDYRKFGVGGGGIKYLDAGNRYGGDPEMVGKVPSRRVKDEFISSAGIPQIDEELVGGSVEQPSSGGNFLSNFVDKAKSAWDENTRLANELGREQDLVQDARDHYSEEGAMTVRPQDSTSVTGFTMSPEMVFETQYKKTPDKRYGTDLSVRNTYSVDPSEVSEVANPDTFKEIERAAWKQQAERGEEVVDMMNEVAKTDEGAGFLANFLSKDKEKRFIDAPREETY